jgi:hypothetical protein
MDFKLQAVGKKTTVSILREDALRLKKLSRNKESVAVTISKLIDLAEKKEKKNNATTN